MSSYIPEPTTPTTPNTPDPTSPNTPDPGGTCEHHLTPIRDHNIKNSWGNISMKDPRKDSGIRSRRSSIQAQIFGINGMSPGDLLTHRVSGYYTSSQSSMAEQRMEFGDVSSVQEPGKIPLNESLTRFHQLRKQSDLQLIRCMQLDNNHKQYIVAPPLSSVSLFFVNHDLEKQYRQQVHRPRPNDPPTLASPQFNTYFDILVSMLVYTGVSISIFLLYPPPTLRWLLLCPISAGWHLVVFLICQSQVVRQEGVNSSSTLATRMYKWITRWHPWHVCGASLICLPLVAVFANFSCIVIKEEEPDLRFFCYLIFVSLIHLCNFTQLNCWMKSILATVATIILLVLVVPPICPCPKTIKNNTDEIEILSTVSNSRGRDTHYFHAEVVMASILLLFLVWILNRQFEISYRLSYHGSVVAMKDKIRVENMKDQADWLLHNIIPRHVADSIKSTAKYSENHKGVAVLFASIVNFNELYDEDYLGGKEYLRVLNELVADFDELLMRPQFKNIEKIKTIGSTYMAASGLNPEVRNSNIDAHQHIFELVEFAMAMQGAIANFNKDLIEFELYLRIGLNFGDVTAGVIGTTKLYYDIWGDAVNIASRMDTTGVKDHIQVSQDCAAVLSRRYELVPRGQVYVKGKDNMNVFLLKGLRKDLPPDT
ncbi:unnamed protein product, partial [Meganyctiphanes norvegica]